MTNGSVICDIAVERYKNAARWLNLWNILLYVFGGFLILFLIYLIVYLIQSNIINSILGVLATIVDGVVLKWVVDQRNDAKQVEKEAMDYIVNNCKDKADEATAFRKRMKIA
jgi:hypothetical protein